MSEQLYKWLDGNTSTHGGTGGWRKGRWRSVRGPLVPCQNGLHLCREKDLLGWIAPTLWLAEHDGELVDAGDKLVVRRARVVGRLDGWNERTARLFAADCAERVLPLFESRYPDDDRPRKAIEAARLLANGEIGSAADSAAHSAAYSAAHSAAYSAAGSAAYSAARSAREWQTVRLLDYAHGRAA